MIFKTEKSILVTVWDAGRRSIEAAGCALLTGPFTGALLRNNCIYGTLLNMKLLFFSFLLEGV